MFQVKHESTKVRVEHDLDPDQPRLVLRCGSALEHRIYCIPKDTRSFTIYIPKKHNVL